jgi:outer membrane protein
MRPQIFSAASAALILFMSGAAIAAPAKPAATAPVATQPAAPPEPPIKHGPNIPGICVISNRGAIAQASVGKAIDTRMQQLRAQVSAELQAEQTTLQSDISAFQAKRASLSPEQSAVQAAPLQQRAQAFDAKAYQRQRELEATFQGAVNEVGLRLTPIIRALYERHVCSILLNGEAVEIYKPDMDLTKEAAEQLNAVMPTIAFDRKILPAQQQPQQ